MAARGLRTIRSSLAVPLVALGLVVVAAGSEKTQSADGTQHISITALEMMSDLSSVQAAELAESRGDHCGVC